MTKNDTKEGIIKIDDKEYALADLSETARMHVANIKFVDALIQQRNNEWAISDTARLAYTAALKRELTKSSPN
jgi:hypothetical protein